MKDSDFKVYRDRFEKEIEKRNGILELSSDENVIKYLKLKGKKPSKPLSDLEIIRKVFKDHNLYGDDILFVQGVYLGMDSFEYPGELEKKELISDSEVEGLIPKINKYNRNSERKYMIRYRIFNPITIYINYPFEEDKRGILLPSYNSNALKATNRIAKIELEDLYNKKMAIAKYLLLLKLMHNNYDDMVEYYNNPLNHKKIENEIDSYMNTLKLKGPDYFE